METIHQLDRFMIIHISYFSFNYVINSRKNTIEGYTAIEKRFRASKAKLIQAEVDNALLQSLFAFILTSIENNDPSQKTRIFSVCTATLKR